VSLIQQHRAKSFPTGERLEIREVANANDRQTAMILRRAVFWEEQGLADLPMTDPDDPRSHTVLAILDGMAVATGRLTPPLPQKLAYLSWIATLREYRRLGIGSEVVRTLLARADERRYPQTMLSAQTHAIDFYRRFGFQPVGRIFSVRGIQHQAMMRVMPVEGREDASLREMETG
jgi:predicted GNAT family N-acyltransferase